MSSDEPSHEINNSQQQIESAQAAIHKYPLLFIGNVSPQATDDELRRVFETVGKVASILIPKTRAGESKGVAFVQYDDDNDNDDNANDKDSFSGEGDVADRAIQKLNEYLFLGRNLRVQIARPFSETEKQREEKRMKMRHRPTRQESGGPWQGDRRDKYDNRPYPPPQRSNSRSFDDRRNSSNDGYFSRSPSPPNHSYSNHRSHPSKFSSGGYNDSYSNSNYYPDRDHRPKGSSRNDHYDRNDRGRFDKPYDRGFERSFDRNFDRDNGGYYDRNLDGGRGFEDRGRGGHGNHFNSRRPNDYDIDYKGRPHPRE